MGDSNFGNIHPVLIISLYKWIQIQTVAEKLWDQEVLKHASDIDPEIHI